MGGQKQIKEDQWIEKEKGRNSNNGFFLEETGRLQAVSLLRKNRRKCEKKRLLVKTLSKMKKEQELEEILRRLKKGKFFYLFAKTSGHKNQIEKEWLQ